MRKKVYSDKHAYFVTDRHPILLLYTMLSAVQDCVTGNCKPPPMAESRVRSWKLACMQTRIVTDFNNRGSMKYQEIIPETNILALIVHEIICSGLNHNNNLIKIPNPGSSRYTDYLSVYRLRWQPCSLILTAPSVGKYSVY